MLVQDTKEVTFNQNADLQSPSMPTRLADGLELRDALLQEPFLSRKLLENWPQKFGSPALSLYFELLKQDKIDRLG